MSAFVDFLPSSTAVFQFLATLANGAQYNIATPWNVLGERYYITVADLSGNVILHRSITQSGPMFNATITWAGGMAAVALTVPHNVPIAQLVNARISQTGTAFDGSYQALSVDPQTLTFQLGANPGEATAVSGKLDFPLDLLAGYGIGTLYFHADTQQFEF